MELQQQLPFDMDPFVGAALPCIDGLHQIRAITESVDATGNTRAYWAATTDGHRVMLVPIQRKVSDKGFPSFDAMILKEDFDSRNEQYCIRVELLDENCSDVFEVVCVDIANTMAKTDRSKTWGTLKNKLEHWAKLTKSQEVLKDTTQQGLMGELFFLDKIAVRALGAEKALLAWRGPNRGPRDFVFGKTAVEVKSKSRESDLVVSISNERQLETVPGEKVFLYVVRIGKSTTREGVTLREMVDRMKDSISPDDTWIRRTFETRLWDYGYRDDDAYDEIRWVESDTLCYEIKDGFPRITPETLHSWNPALAGASYTIDLTIYDKPGTDHKKLKSRLSRARQKSAG